MAQLPQRRQRSPAASTPPTMTARRSRSSMAALAAALGAGALLSQVISFVPHGAPGLRGDGVARRAVEQETEKETDYKLPKPDFSMVNRNANVGMTRDADRRGNVWSADVEARKRDEDEPFPAILFFPIGGALFVIILIFLAKLTGTDPNYGS